MKRTAYDEDEIHVAPDYPEQYEDMRKLVEELRGVLPDETLKKMRAYVDKLEVFFKEYYAEKKHIRESPAEEVSDDEILSMKGRLDKVSTSAGKWYEWAIELWRTRFSLNTGMPLYDFAVLLEQFKRYVDWALENWQVKKNDPQKVGDFLQQVEDCASYSPVLIRRSKEYIDAERKVESVQNELVQSAKSVGGMELAKIVGGMTKTWGMEYLANRLQEGIDSYEPPTIGVSNESLKRMLKSMNWMRGRGFSELKKAVGSFIWDYVAHPQKIKYARHELEDATSKVGALIERIDEYYDEMDSYGGAGKFEDMANRKQGKFKSVSRGSLDKYIDQWVAALNGVKSPLKELADAAVEAQSRQHNLFVNMNKMGGPMAID